MSRDIDLILASPMGSDCTAEYLCLLKSSMTVKTFIELVLKDDTEWGYIGINSKDGSVFGNPRIEYNNGKVKTDINVLSDFMDKNIKSARASGGWSRMDYLLEVEE